MLKRIFLLLFAICMFFFLCACDSQNASSQEDKKFPGNVAGKTLKIGELNGKVSVGTFHAAIIDDSGMLKGCGWWSDCGGDEASEWTDIIQVAASIDHTVGLKKDGSVVAAGKNHFGQCDVSNWSDIVAIAAGYVETYGLTKDGTIVATASNAQDYYPNNDYVKISASSGLLLALREGGMVDGFEGTETWNNIIDISAGPEHALGLREDGTVVATGDNWFGQCEVESWRNIISVSAGDEYSLGLKADGTVEYAGSSSHLNAVKNWKNIVAIFSGGMGTMGIKSDGTVVFACGDDVQGKNVYDWINVADVAVAYNFTAALKTDGTVESCSNFSDDPCAWWNGDIKKIACSSSYLFGVTSNGKVELITLVGALPDENIEQARQWGSIIDIAAGRTHVVGVLNDGTVIARGSNNHGQSNVSNWNNVISVYASNYHTVGLLNDGTVVATGDNKYGQCNVSDWRNIKTVVVNDYNTIGVTNDGKVLVAGSNENGIYNAEKWENIKSICVGYDYILGVTIEGKIIAEGKTEDIPREIFEWENIEKVKMQGDHIVALKRDGTVTTNDYVVKDFSFFNS